MKRNDRKKDRPSPGKAKTIVFQVKENSQLLTFLLEQLPSKSRTKIKLLLSAKRILVDGQSVSQFDHPLVPGQKVEIGNEKAVPQKNIQDYEIVYEDQDIVVISKPAGLLSIATENEKRATAYSGLSDHVKKQDPSNKIFIVHRLDRETSGLMLFAKSELVKRKLQDSWDDTVIDRSYVAVVEGSVEKPSGVVVSYLFEDKSFRVHSSPIPGKGKKAVTRYTVLKKSKNYTLLKLNLETGRKNQIRVHAQEIGHSVAGDKKYGAVTNPIRRLALHARQLAFIHPVSGEKLNFETAIPSAFLRLFKI